MACDCFRPEMITTVNRVSNPIVVFDNYDLPKEEEMMLQEANPDVVILYISANNCYVGRNMGIRHAYNHGAEFYLFTDSDWKVS